MPIPFQTAHDPILSLFQSAASAFARAISGATTHISTHPMPQAATHIIARQTTAEDPTPALECASLGLQLLRALVANDTDQIDQLQNRLAYSNCDPRWSETLFEYARRFLPDGNLKPVPYIRHKTLADFIITAKNPAMRIALISDWGTGTGEARHVAALLAAQNPDAIIHLGDIYFAGTHAECQLHFLQPLRSLLPETPLFTLCGNHDVYSGGEGFYALLKQIGQPASYFCLRSPDLSWQILGADTGLNDRNPFNETDAITSLEPTEEDWHADKLRGFPGQTILLTHHQPFSPFRQIGPASLHSPVNPNLMASHARLAEAGTIDAWFWGHEHTLRLYAPYRGINAGRNIGYGAVPLAASDAINTPMPNLTDPPTILTYVPLDIVDGAYTHGFALLDIAPGTLDVSYWAVTRPDAPIHQESLARPVA